MAVETTAAVEATAGFFEISGGVEFSKTELQPKRPFYLRGG